MITELPTNEQTGLSLTDRIGHHCIPKSLLDFRFTDLRIHVNSAELAELAEKSKSRAIPDLTG